MSKVVNFFANKFRSIKILFLKIELRNNSFFIGGYEDRMMKIESDGRWLKEWEVEQVHKWKSEGKVKFSYKSSITSPNTGENYTSNYYRLL